MKKPAAVRSYALTAASLLSAVAAAHGQVLFQDNFDTTPSTAWNVNAGTAQDRAVFGFDYSTVGIPAAPNSGGSTVGVMLQANRPGGTPTLSGVSISPTGQTFTGDYQVRYDLWQNAPGPFPAGGTGSTQLTAGGLFTAGTIPHYAGSGDGLWFASTGEGGSGTDYRVYFGPANQTTAGLYAAGSQANTATYYSTAFPGATPPAAQTALFPSQTGTLQNGTLGEGWHQVAITKSGNIVTWDVDGVRLATVDTSATGVPVFPGSNILFAQSDINSTQTTAAADPMLFGLIDNVVVLAVPEPSTYALVGVGALLFAAMRRKK